MHSDPYQASVGARVEEVWTSVAGRAQRSLRAGSPYVGRPELVMVPGLGTLGYLLPTVRRCAEWTRVHVLDVPGFAHPAGGEIAPTVEAIGRAVADWVRTACARPVVLAGHSTGAQAALRAAVTIPDLVDGAGLLGPTFPPAERRVGPLLRAIARTLPYERVAIVPLAGPGYLRGGTRMLSLIRDGMRDRPEEVVSRLGCPLLVVRGEHDALSPAVWARELAARVPDGRVAEAPGGHNIPFFSPEETAAALRSLVVG